MYVCYICVQWYEVIFFKQKTAYELRISDWSSDVCSSDLSNTVENFFSIFKRGVIGTYHHMSEAHLQRYCVEFDFRYNTRKISDTERTDAAITGAQGKRLTYRRLDASQVA